MKWCQGEGSNLRPRAYEFVVDQEISRKPLLNVSSAVSKSVSKLRAGSTIQHFRIALDGRADRHDEGRHRPSLP